MNEQRVITAYINYHFGLPEKFTLNDLYEYLLRDWIYWKENSDHDQRITITIEVKE